MTVLSLSQTEDPLPIHCPKRPNTRHQIGGVCSPPSFLTGYFHSFLFSENQIKKFHFHSTVPFLLVASLNRCSHFFGLQLLQHFTINEQHHYFKHMYQPLQKKKKKTEDRQGEQKEGGSEDVFFFFFPFPSLWPLCVKCQRADSRRLIPWSNVNGTIEDPLWLTALPLSLCPEGDWQCGSSHILWLS